MKRVTFNLITKSAIYRIKYRKQLMKSLKKYKLNLRGALTGVTYSNPMRKLMVAVIAETFHAAIFGNASLTAVFMTP